MSSRPRRSAAQRATAAITNLADQDNNDRTMSSSRRRTNDGAKPGVTIVSRSNNPNSSPGDDTGKHIHLTVKVPSSKLRQATSGGSSKTGSAIVAKGSSDTYGGATRAARAGRKSYVVESNSEEEEEEEEEEDDDDDDGDAVIDDDEEEEDEIQVGSARPALVTDEDAEGEDDDEQMELGDDDAQGEDDEDIMDVDRYQDDNDDEALVGDDGYGDEDAEGEDDDDALGEEDADGDVDMDSPAPPPPTIKISRPSKPSIKAKPAPAKKPSGKGNLVPHKTKSTHAPKGYLDDDDDEELSELESDPDDVNDTVKVGGDEDAEGEDDDMDAEGEEIEVADEDAGGEDDDALGSDDDTPGGGSRDETPDMSRMTARQRAKHGDVTGEYMKLSDEVQVKKHFTAEEHAMRRAEMARRRRNLSEKRNEEVKMETINKLLKKQAPKTNRRVGHLPGEDTPPEFPKPNPVFIRWVSSQKGSIVAVPEEIVDGPAGRVFTKGGLGSGKMVQEVS